MYSVQSSRSPTEIPLIVLNACNFARPEHVVLIAHFAQGHTRR